MTRPTPKVHPESYDDFLSKERKPNDLDWGIKWDKATTSTRIFLFGDIKKHSKISQQHGFEDSDQVHVGFRAASIRPVEENIESFKDFCITYSGDKFSEGLVELARSVQLRERVESEVVIESSKQFFHCSLTTGEVYPFYDPKRQTLVKDTEYIAGELMRPRGFEYLALFVALEGRTDFDVIALHKKLTELGITHLPIGSFLGYWQDSIVDLISKERADIMTEKIPLNPQNKNAYYERLLDVSSSITAYKALHNEKSELPYPAGREVNLPDIDALPHIARAVEKFVYQLVYSDQLEEGKAVSPLVVDQIKALFVGGPGKRGSKIISLPVLLMTEYDIDELPDEITDIWSETCKNVITLLEYTLKHQPGRLNRRVPEETERESASLRRIKAEMQERYGGISHKGGYHPASIISNLRGEK